MHSFSGLIESFLAIIKDIVDHYIFFSLGNNWISDSVIFHIFLVLLLTAFFSLIFNKLIIVLIRSWLSKLNHNIGKRIIRKESFNACRLGNSYNYF